MNLINIVYEHQLMLLRTIVKNIYTLTVLLTE